MVKHLTHVSNLFIENWDTSGVTSMCQLFYKNTTFNGDISKWDVSNVKDMSYMFTFNESFNQDISKWDTGKVKNIFFIFSLIVSLFIVTPILIKK
jgi:surface protein